ncbi:hypothetical protein GCM10009850_105050 [Nonomuraea monospora]|uniref:Methyltransferase n=1 Tax=Nonomuraea monospora TaxID=568818 RepID=A0ABN3D013_9ACTN
MDSTRRGAEPGSAPETRTGEDAATFWERLHRARPAGNARVLRTAAHALRPGGLLLIVDHGSTAPWSWTEDADAHYPTPTEVAAGLDLDLAHWSVLRAGMPRRQATGPAGQTATVVDHVLLVQRGAA